MKRKPMIKVSVIIPVFNTKKFLPQCIESLRQQTLKDIEIISVDDGSTDGSYELLLEYSKLDNRIKVLKNARKGVGAARNTGFDYATGDYIGFVDSDDFVENTMYEKLYTKAILNAVDIAIGGVSLYYADTKREEGFRPEDLYTQYEAYPFFNAKRFPEIIQNIGIWDRIYKKNFLIQNAILNTEDIGFEDHFFTIQTMALADRVCVVNEPFYKYRKNVGTSLTDNEKKIDKHKLDIIEMGRRSKQFLKAEYVYQIFRKPFLFYQFSTALYHQKNAVSFSTFRKIFNILKDTTDLEDYDYLKTVDYNRINRFAFYIKRNQVLQCYFWCKKEALRNP